jgi:hypothetical protein
MELGFGHNEIRVGARFVLDSGIGRAGRPEEDDFGRGLYLARAECKRMAGVGAIRGIEPE